MKLLSIAFLLAICSLTTGAQTRIADVTFPAKLIHNKTELVLNGAGVRKKSFFKIYVAGLYLTEKSKNAVAICDADKPMVIRLQITSDMVNSNNMSKAIREGFDKSTAGNINPIKDRIEAFIEIFNKEKIKEGDLYEIWYIPGQGVQPFKNGKYQTTVVGLDFKKALFGIWLADKPADIDLKKALLGK